MYEMKEQRYRAEKGGTQVGLKVKGKEQTNVKRVHWLSQCPFIATKLKRAKMRNISQIPKLVFISLQNPYGYNLKDNSAIIAFKGDF